MKFSRRGFGSKNFSIQKSLRHILTAYIIHFRSRRTMAILFASLAAASEALSGCVTPAYYEYDAAFDVHRISERSLSGAESIVTIVSPIVSSDSAKAYPDSLRYIIVNGDTAYRHSVSALTPVFDSAAAERHWAALFKLFRETLAPET